MIKAVSRRQYYDIASTHDPCTTPICKPLVIAYHLSHEGTFLRRARRRFRDCGVLSSKWIERSAWWHGHVSHIFCGHAEGLLDREAESVVMVMGDRARARAVFKGVTV